MLELISVVIVIITSLILSLAIYRNNPKSATNRTFIFAGGSVIFWAITTYFSLHAPKEQILFFVRLSMLSGTLMASSFLLLAQTFPNDSFKVKKKWFIPMCVLSTLTMIIAMSPFMFTHLKITGNNIEPVPGPGIVFFIITALGYNVVTFIILIFKYLRAKGRLRNQLQFIVLGVVLMFVCLISTNFIAVIAFKNSKLVFLGPVFGLFFTVSVAYAILKHRLLEIRSFIARSITFSLLITASTIIYASLLYITAGFLTQGKISLNQVGIYAALALFIAISFQRLRIIIEKITARLFFKDQYSSNELLSNLTKIMASTLQLETLTQKTLNELLTQMHILKGAFLILNGKDFYPPVLLGYTKTLQYNFELITKFASKIIYIFEDETDENIKQAMRELEASVILPLYVDRNLHGLLILSEKKSGDIYSNQDVEVLKIFASEVSVAVQNSKAYEEIKNFNLTLTKKIEIATKDIKLVNTKLQEIDRIKDDFLSITSHELRTPMTAIRSYVWMAIHRSDIPLSPRLRKYLYRTLISTERLINLVNDMLNISRIESGRVEILPKAFNMTGLVEDVMVEIAVKAKEKNLHLDIIKTPMPQVFADEEKVRQVLMNLIGNALKFTPLQGSVTISFFTDGETVTTYVKDSGVGISKDDLTRLFKKFGRLDNSYVAAATSGGTGLGLFISKQLIELMKGRIGAQSEGQNKGSIFYFTLPAATPLVLQNSDKYTIRVDGEVKLLEPMTI